MSDNTDLWNRIDEARRRLGAADQAQIRQIEDLNERVKAVRADLSTRYRELEAHRDEVSKLRRENEQLRNMMHRLLLTIEERYGGRLKDILHNLESEIRALVTLSEEPAGATPEAPPAHAPVSDAPRRAVKAKAAPQAPDVKLPASEKVASGAGGPPGTGNEPAPAAAAETPSEKDSRWLHEIMERARELTGERTRGNEAAALNPPSRSAVA